MGEPVNLGHVDPGRRGDLFNRCARTDSGLNILGTQHASALVVSRGLTWSHPITARSSAQPVVYPNQKLVRRVATLADDVLAIDIEPDECEFPHVDLLRSDSNSAPHDITIRTRPRRGVVQSGAQSRSTTQSTHRVRAVTSSGSIAGNMATRSWLRPSFR